MVEMNEKNFLTGVQQRITAKRWLDFLYKFSIENATKAQPSLNVDSVK